MKLFTYRLAALLWLINNSRHMFFLDVSAEDVLYGIKGFRLDDLIQGTINSGDLNWFNLVSSFNEYNNSSSPWENNQCEDWHPANRGSAPINTMSRHHREWRKEKELVAKINSYPYGDYRLAKYSELRINKYH